MQYYVQAEHNYISISLATCIIQRYHWWENI